MAKQTFTTGSVLTAAQMNNLQANDYNWSVDSKSASYVLVAADAGKRIEMNAAGATTITVNTGLFTAGDMVYISNIGAGTCTVTAGTATVNKSSLASLALAQYQSGILYFVSASSAIFYPYFPGVSASSKSYSLLNAGGTALTGAATVTISGVTGDDLLIMVVGASSVNTYSNILVRFNGVTANKYAFNGAYTQGNSTYGVGVFARSQNAPDTQDGVYLAAMSSNAASTISGYVRIYGCKSTTVKPFTSVGGASDATGNGQVAYHSGGIFNDTAAITSVSIFSQSGNLDAGTVYVYEAQ